VTDAITRAAFAIGEGDMGPGISLRAALRAGMDQYYPDNPKGCAGCVEWALRRAAKRALASVDTRPDGGDGTKIAAPSTGGATLEEGDAHA
jgi:hypothetical protein